MADTHPAGARRPLGRDHGQPSRLGAPIPDRCVHLDTRPAVGSARHHGWKRSGLGGSQHGVRDGSVSRSRRAATDSQYPPEPARPRGAGPAYPASHRTLLLYPVAHNPAAAVIASQPSVRHQGVQQRKRGPATRPTRPTGRGMSTTVLRQRLRRQGRPSRSARVTRTSPGARWSGLLRRPGLAGGHHGSAGLVRPGRGQPRSRQDGE
jgi:hypothetical protein